MPFFVQIFRLFALLLIAGALFFAPMPGHSGHDAGALISVEDAAHDHDHDHDHPHPPSHDAADHSHQVLFMADNVTQSAFSSANRWRLMAFSLPDSGIAFGLERPPRQA
jgi:ABC-type Zn2+ transport system substrate-binding protein/surface adhesin